MPSKQSSRIPARWRKPILALAVVCLAAAAMLIASRQPSPAEDQPRVETAIVAARSQEPAVAQPTASGTQAAARPEARRPAASRTRAAAEPARPVRTETTTAAKVAAPAPATNGSTADLVSRSAAGESTARAPRVEAAPSAAAQDEAATITGCLEFDDDKFRLKDTEGENAPKSRSWRSGFLRRSNARIDVIDEANRLQLSTHVGHRVTLTGTLVEREMQARSLQMVAEACED